MLHWVLIQEQFKYLAEQLISTYVNCNVKENVKLCFIEWQQRRARYPSRVRVWSREDLFDNEKTQIIIDLNNVIVLPHVNNPFYLLY